MDSFQGYTTAAGDVIFNTTQVIDPFHVVHLAGDKPRGRLKKLFDFNDDYAPLHLAVPDPRRQHPTHNQCTLKPEEPLNGGISKDFSRHFTPNRFQTGRLSRFGVKCRLFGGERGWHAHQRPPTPANPSQAMVVKNVLLRVVPRPNPRRTNQCTLKPEKPFSAPASRLGTVPSRGCQGRSGPSGGGQCPYRSLPLVACPAP
ncbi:hypothetical protein FRC0549_01773 [Corynebacterium diphtheriae]|nr:hypothetical protein FRC0549_01773 [Corynebacterium diphtheriae]